MYFVINKAITFFSILNLLNHVFHGNIIYERGRESEKESDWVCFFSVCMHFGFGVLNNLLSKPLSSKITQFSSWNKTADRFSMAFTPLGMHSAAVKCPGESFFFSSSIMLCHLSMSEWTERINERKSVKNKGVWRLPSHLINLCWLCMFENNVACVFFCWCF